MVSDSDSIKDFVSVKIGRTYDRLVWYNVENKGSAVPHRPSPLLLSGIWRRRATHNRVLSRLLQFGKPRFWTSPVLRAWS